MERDPQVEAAKAAQEGARNLDLPTKASTERQAVSDQPPKEGVAESADQPEEAAPVKKRNRSPAVAESRERET